MAIFHQRYSTNTFPQWSLAQPFRVIAHNGEINTVKGNVNWMKSHEIRMASEAFGPHGEDIKPVVQAGASDSAALDQVFEVLIRSGRSAPAAKALLIPEAWSKRSAVMPEKWRALYEYCNAVMEPWDGPAAIAAYDGGQWALAGLDRNGLRPLRYAITDDDILAVGSETGMCPVDPAKVTKRGLVEPGRMIALNLKEKKLYTDEMILDDLASRHEYDEWLENIVDLEAEIGEQPERQLFEGDDLRRRQTGAGYSVEDLEIILKPMAADGKEALGSMGDDTPLAVLSENYRPLSHFFRQNFSQVTNPPIDPLRESRVMSLKTRFKNLGNILAQDKTQTDVYVLESPILTNGLFESMRAFLGEGAVEIDCTYRADDIAGRGDALGAALERIMNEAKEAVGDRKAQHLILSDMNQGPERLAAPMILVAGAVHGHLTKAGLRTFCSLNIRSAECMDSHYAAVLIGLGATTVNPYVACDTVANLCARAGDNGPGVEAGVANYKKALDGGLLKILSKMGISVISSYRGGCNFEIIGLSRAVAEAYLPGTPSRISGIGLAGLELKCAELHRKAWRDEAARLPIGGFYRFRASGERHSLEAELISDLQKAVRQEDYDAYARYSEALQSQHPVQLRDLLDMQPLDDRGIPLEDVESVNQIYRRFVTPGMSLGALSPEAHGALNIAMNRIGAKSVSGEGGEVPERYKPLPNGDNPNSAVKQIASGRFGVTAEYLNQCREIEIKVAQGAKPGEGGQLPGFKVTDFIARMRHSTPGVTLISPPPHHDIYSIEDLAQLIYDLKQINPDARVCVKLVSAAGVGTIAVGVAKAKADVILISGNVGGTGASPQTSIKFAGAPMELGLAEAHQLLTLNDLREKVTLRADGGMRTGRDIVIAAMLGAEEFGVGTISLVAMGCLMVRQCHSNTCPVGICTQDESLRDKFVGKPEQVVNLMTFIGEEVRQILAGLGAKSLEDVIGRADLLNQVSRGAPHLDDLDLNAVLRRVDSGARPPRSRREGRQDVDDETAETVDAKILVDASPVFSRREKMQLSYGVKNTDRTVGARVSSKIVRTYGPEGLPENHLTVRLRGSAGQSLGAFGAKGLKLEVDGDANDYVGKGLSGATLVIRPYAAQVRTGHEQAIIGNTCLYGATSGTLMAAGRAGQRFAVRNSGATAVVAGCGANGCEYMTGGRVVLLGSVGDNFAAGMTGGRAYVYDPEERLEGVINGESVIYRRMSAEAQEICRELIETYQRETRSQYAKSLLDNWAIEAGAFWEVVPRELLALEDQGDDAERASA